MSVVQRISHAINQSRPHRSLSVNLVIALSFAVIAMGAMVYNATIVQLAQAADAEVNVTQPVGDDDVYFVGGGFPGGNVLSVEWSYANYTGDEVADITLQEQISPGVWQNKYTIANNFLMGSDPATYDWTITDLAHTGEAQRIAVTVNDNGATYTNYSGLVYIRELGLHFIVPELGSAYNSGETLRAKFYLASQVVPVQSIWSVLSYRDNAGVYQEIQSRFLDTWPVDATGLKYHDWFVPYGNPTNYTSRLQLSTYLLGSGGEYDEPYMEGESSDFTIVSTSGSAKIGLILPHDGPTLYWGNGYAITVEVLGMSDEFDVVLTGEAPIGPIEYPIYNDIYMDGGLTLAWELEHDAGYCEFGALSQVQLSVQSSDGAIEYGVSEPFDIDSLIHFIEPEDHTCSVPWLGALPEINYPGGQVLPVELALEPFDTGKWMGAGSPNTFSAGLFRKDGTGPWEPITTDINDFTFNSDGTTVTYDWDIPETDVTYSTQLEFILNVSSPYPVIPSNARHFARTYPFNITPPPPPGEATLWLDPATTTISVGDSLDLDIYLDTGGEEVVGIDLNIAYDVAYLAKDASEPFTSDWPVVFIDPDSLESEIVVSVVSISPTVVGDNVYVGTIHLTAIADTDSQTTALVFVEAVNDLDDGTRVVNIDSIDILGQAVDADVTIDPLPLPTELAGTYYSGEFAVEGSGVVINSLDNFTTDAVSDEGYSEVNFAVQFRDSSGTQIGSGDPGENGFYFVSDTDPLLHISRLNNIGVDLSLISSIQIRIGLSTDDYGLYQPSVGEVVLAYSTNTPSDQAIGIFAFANGTSSKTVSEGESIDYGVIITSMSDIAHTVDLAVNVEDNGLSGIVASIFNPNDNSSTILLTPGMSITATLRFDANNAQASSPYNFEITGTVASNPQYFIAPLGGTITVTGAVADPGFSLSISPSSKVAQPDALITFNISATYDTGFVGDVALSSDIASLFEGDLIDVTIQPSVITPDDTSPAILSFTTESWDNVIHQDEEIPFSVTGVFGSIVADDSAQLTIAETAPEYPAITVNVTVPVEGAKSSSHPRFTFRLYQDGETDNSAWAFEVDDLQTSITDTVTVAVEEGMVQDQTDYVGYIRSTRHLWAKATNPLGGIISIDTSNSNHPEYELTFPKLTAGDISPSQPDNVINSGDFGRLISDFGKTFSGLLPDFNEDGTVNTIDITYIIGNWFKRGELPS